MEKSDRVQPNSGKSDFARMPDSYPSVPLKAEGNLSSARITNHWSPHQYTEVGQVGSGTQSQVRGQMPHPDLGIEKGIQQDMEIGYEDKPSPLTLEALEKKFVDEIMKLAKEESDADDAENSRHRERKVEISKHYQEKISELRALQAKQREEFLYKETQERLHQYHHQRQPPVPNNYPTDKGPLDHHGYRPNPYSTDIPVGDPRGYGPHHYPMDSGTMDPHWYGPSRYPTDRSPTDPRGYGGPAIIEPHHRGYAPGPHMPYVEGSPYSQVQRNQQEAEGRVPIPQGRAYNNTRARNF